jgi:molybdate transport system regulatory protein
MRPALVPKFKLWLSTAEEEGVFGDGKYRLLRAIESCGSLRSAADSLGISYRKAWGDLKKAERILGVRLIDRTRGGSAGGGMVLTDAGRRWVGAFAWFRAGMEKSARDEFRTMLEEVFEGDPSGGEIAPMKEK